MTLDLDAIQARADTATEGPWFLDSNGMDHAFVGNRSDGRQHGLWEIVHMSGDRLADLKPECAEQVRDDAVFIAYARQDIPALIARIRELESEVLELMDEAGNL